MQYCHTEGHTTDNCKFVDYFDQDVQQGQSCIYCEICKIASNHTTKDYQYNLCKSKGKCCSFWEDNRHSTQEWEEQVKVLHHLLYENRRSVQWTTNVRRKSVTTVESWKCHSFPLHFHYYVHYITSISLLCHHIHPTFIIIEPHLCFSNLY